MNKIVRPVAYKAMALLLLSTFITSNAFSGLLDFFKKKKTVDIDMSFQGLIRRKTEAWYKVYGGAVTSKLHKDDTAFFLGLMDGMEKKDEGWLSKKVIALLDAMVEKQNGLSGLKAQDKTKEEREFLTSSSQKDGWQEVATKIEQYIKTECDYSTLQPDAITKTLKKFDKKIINKVIDGRVEARVVIETEVLPEFLLDNSQAVQAKSRAALEGAEKLWKGYKAAAEKAKKEMAKKK